MPYVAPSTVVAGQTYGAAAHNVIVNDVIDHESRLVTATNQSVQVFTNEAARDAAITSPSEGMHAYLTAPTVPAVTGTYADAVVPSGVLTVYNGSVWVCRTPITAQTPNQQTTSSTSYTDLATSGPAVTLVTGSMALVTIGALSFPSAGTGAAYMAVAVSGATTIVAPAGDVSSNFIEWLSGERTKSMSFIVGGLTAGTNTFTCKYKSSSSTTSAWQGRVISVVGIA